MSNETRLTFLTAKAFAYAKSLATLSESERKLKGTQTFAEDYNDLRDKVAQWIDESDLVPPKVTIVEYGSGLWMTLEPLAEIYVFTEQIYQLLVASLPDDSSSS